MMQKTRKTAALIVLASLTACSSLQPVADTQAFFAKEAPRFVVVTTTDDETEEPLILSAPRLEGGAITGMAMGEATTVPITRVKTIQATQRDRRKTTMALVIGGVIVGGLGYLMSTSGDGATGTYECNPEETAGRCY